MNRIRAGCLSIFAVLLILTNQHSAHAGHEVKIGVLMFSEEARYSEAKNGILDQLKEAGFGVKYTMENAGGSKAKAVEVAREFAEAKMDLIFTIGTSATIPVAKTIKDVPIVFSMVYDPVESGIAMDWKSSNNNTTGASSRVPMSKIIHSLKEFAPAKRLVVLYTPGEKNTELQLKELQGIQADARIKVVPIILTKQDEVAQTLSKVVHTADAMYLTGSSIIGETVPIIVDTANKAKVVTITHLDDLVEKGALLGVCANSYLVGRLAGRKAVKILRGAKPSSILIETEEKLDLIINMKTAKSGQFRIPPDFMQKVTRAIE